MVTFFFFKKTEIAKATTEKRKPEPDFALTADIADMKKFISNLSLKESHFFKNGDFVESF